MPAAQPLKVTPASTPARQGSSSTTSSLADRTPTVTPATTGKQANGAPAAAPVDISSPHELTAYVESLLEQLDTKFDEMSSQLLERMTQMSSRVDSLEASIQDIINTDVGTPAPSVPQSPAPNGMPNMRRTGSGLSS
ncbi:hypothetical protein PUNSTDRAFT_139002 [Punctularia strigosozonata HHB-11173 SS5]|uniref:Heat shock factor binding protein 1-domain-containing protein n=1 Tax=Punctularia strigosozonata (strain HHB-11173) TaxID=741275 RepID=R7S161_PUNST|nr:uncharacterized protein PUNSTDRAFT_139002 [Punctularia strigosozonata HHB-11173 SS5]EIN03958.1 hypothetical protein PUNSTDRAFT_139002 [Punctularia strigosozonata HHB-11173 SS5]